MRFRWPFPLPVNLGLAAGVILFSLFWLWLWNGRPEIFREHGPMENFQVGCLLTGIFLLTYVVGRSPNRSLQTFFAALILPYFTLLVVEFDVRPFGIPWLTLLLKGPVRNTVLVLLWLTGLVLFLRDRPGVWNAFVSWISRPAGVLLLLAGGFWVLGGLIDKRKPFESREQNFMAEELMECNAALLMLTCAFLIWLGVVKRRSPEPLVPQPDSPISTKAG